MRTICLVMLPAPVETIEIAGMTTIETLRSREAVEVRARAA